MRLLLTFFLLMLLSKLHAQQPRVSTKQPEKQYPAKSPQTNSPTQDSLQVKKADPQKTKPLLTPKGTVSLGLLGGAPFGNYYESVNGADAWGVGFGVLFNLIPSHIRNARKQWVNPYIGGNFQWMRQATTTDRFYYSDPFFRTDIESKVRNNLTSFGIVSRLELFPGVIQVFGEVGAGFSFLSGVHVVKATSTAVNGPALEEPREVTNRQNLSTSTISNTHWGFGIRLAGNKGGIEVKYLDWTGSQATFIDIESVSFNRANNSVQYDLKSSAVHYGIFQLSFSAKF